MSTNTNSAKLTPYQVQQIRMLHQSGFRTRSIAAAFDVCTRTVANIIKRRSWWHLLFERVELPVFAPDSARRLRLRSYRRLTDQQRADIDTYRNALASALEDQAEREGLAVALLSEWRPRQPGGRRTPRKEVA